MAHVLQVVTEADPSATVLSIDGIRALDSMSWEALSGDSAGRRRRVGVTLRRQDVPRSAVDQPVGGRGGTVHDIHQGEEGDQEDPLMPLLLSATAPNSGSSASPNAKRDSIYFHG